MDIRINHIVFAFVLALSTVSSENIECPQCMHVGYTFTNMPSIYESIIGGVLASLNMSDPACQYNTLQSDFCPAPGAGNQSKCETFVLKVKGVGFSTSLPSAGMTVEVVSRSCSQRPLAEADICMDVEDMGAANPELGASLTRMTSRFNTVNYTGEQCFTSANATKITTVVTEDTTTTEAPKPIITSGVGSSTPTPKTTTVTPTPTEAPIEVSGCSECFHIGMHTVNMPAFAENMMNNVLKSMNLTNQACADNTIPSTTCSAALPGTVNKCHDVTFSVHAIGMTDVLPDAEVHMDVIVRACEAVPVAEAADGCSPVQTAMDAASMAQVMTSIQQMSDRFDTVTYNGTSCLFPVGSKAPTEGTTRTLTAATTTEATTTTDESESSKNKDKDTSDGENGSSQISLSLVCLLFTYILHL